MHSIRLEGDVKGLLKRLKRFSEIDKKQINSALAEAARTSTLDRFRLEKSPGGKKWESSVRADTEGGKTLTDSARLKNSIKTSSNASGFAIGTNTIYASTHQMGAKGRRITIRAKTPKGLIFKYGDRWVRKREVKIKVNIPARPFLGLSEDDLQEIKGMLEDVLSGE